MLTFKYENKNFLNRKENIMNEKQRDIYSEIIEKVDYDYLQMYEIHTGLEHGLSKD